MYNVALDVVQNSDGSVSVSFDVPGVPENRPDLKYGDVIVLRRAGMTMPALKLPNGLVARRFETASREVANASLCGYLLTCVGLCGLVAACVGLCGLV